MSSDSSSNSSESTADTLTLNVTKRAEDEKIFDLELGDVMVIPPPLEPDPEEEKQIKRAVTNADIKLKGKAALYLEKESWTSKYLNKGTISNMMSFCVMVIGIILFYFDSDSNVSKYVLSFGLFSFSGGFTNWLAIKMLFDKVPFLIGSGVILREFKVIRTSIKSIIMEMFFDKEFLQEYLAVRSQDIIRRTDIKGIIHVALSNPKIEQLMAERLKEAAKGKKVGNQFLKGILRVQKAEKLVKVLKPVLGKLASEIVPAIVKNVEFAQLVNMDTVEGEVEKLLTDKLELLTPELIKKLLERLIREHLGWLVVWGNVFGGLIGIASQAAGFSS